jgi:hypothetical protein
MRQELFVDRVDDFTMASNLSIYTPALRVCVSLGHVNPDPTGVQKQFLLELQLSYLPKIIRIS